VAALLTDSVGAGCQPLECCVDLGQVNLDLQDKRRDLRSFERDRRTLGIVFVVSVGVAGGRHDLVEVAGQARETPDRLLSFSLEQFASPVHLPMLTPLAATKTIGRTFAPVRTTSDRERWEVTAGADLAGVFSAMAHCEAAAVLDARDRGRRVQAQQGRRAVAVNSLRDGYDVPQQRRRRGREDR